MSTLLKLMLLLFVGAIVLHFCNFRTGNDRFRWLALGCCALATLLFIICMNNAGSSGAAGYAYYVNGARVSSGLISGGQSFALFLILSAASFGLTMGLGKLIYLPTRTPKEKQDDKAMRQYDKAVAEAKAKQARARAAKMPKR